MPNQLRAKYNDYDGTTQTASLNVKTEAHATLAPKLATLQSEIDAWLIGRVQSVEHVIEISDIGPGKAPSPAAQKGLQLILEIEDSVSLVTYRERLPMPYLSKPNDGTGDGAWIPVGQGGKSLTVMNTAHEAWDTLKAAYDAVGVSPEGNAATLLRAYVEK